MKVRPHRTSVRSQILSGTLIVGLLPLVVLATVAVLGLRTLNTVADRRVSESRQTIARESVAARLSAESASVGREIELALAAYVDLVLSWAAEPVMIAAATSGDSTAAPFLALMQTVNPEVVDLLYTDRDGVAVGGTGSDVGINLSDSVLWQRAWSDSVDLGDVVVQPESGRVAIPVAVAIHHDLGVRVGVLRALVDVGIIQSIADRRGAFEVDVTVLTVDGLLLAETITGHDPTRIGRAYLGVADLSEGARYALDTIEGSLVGVEGVYGFGPVEFSSALAAADPAREDTRWLVVAGQPTDLAFAPLAGFESLNEELDGASRELVWVVLIVVLFAGFIAITMAAMLTRHIVAPITRLTDRARHVAEHGLPSAVSELLDADDSDQPAIDLSLEIEIDNELGDLTKSFNSVQRRAIELAGEQAIQRRNTLRMFTNLGRRNQSLVKRQLRFIEELEQSEEDAQRLAPLFKLDRLATRMRRGAESLLVIAGDRSPVGRTAPAHIELVVQTALGEVENYERVQADDIESVALTGRPVNDVAHMIAELVDNALSFSPPDSLVEVTGRNGALNYTLTITDRGIGLSDSELALANQRLESSTNIHLTRSLQLGLIVVSKLADRHGISVRLATVDKGGVEAVIEIPGRLVASVDEIRNLSQLSNLGRQHGWSREIDDSAGGVPAPGHRAAAKEQPAGPPEVATPARPEPVQADVAPFPPAPEHRDAVEPEPQCSDVALFVPAPERRDVAQPEPERSDVAPFIPEPEHGDVAQSEPPEPERSDLVEAEPERPDVAKSEPEDRDVVEPDPNPSPDVAPFLPEPEHREVVESGPNPETEDRDVVKFGSLSSSSNRLPPPLAVDFVIAGGFGVGKTTFVGSVSEITPLRTEAAMTEIGAAFDGADLLEAKESTTVALDFGRLTVDNDLFMYLFGTPGPGRFGFMWDDIVEGALGALVLVDSRRLDDCYPAIDYFEERDIPFVVVLNHFDTSHRPDLAAVRYALNIAEDVPFVECDARDKQSVFTALLSMLEHLLTRLIAVPGGPFSQN